MPFFYIRFGATPLRNFLSPPSGHCVANQHATRVIGTVIAPFGP